MVAPQATRETDNEGRPAGGGVRAEAAGAMNAIVRARKAGATRPIKMPYIKSFLKLAEAHIAACQKAEKANDQP